MRHVIPETEPKPFSGGPGLLPEMIEKGLSMGSIIRVRWTPHPVIVAIRDNKDKIRILVYFYYITITGWGVLLK